MDSGTRRHDLFVKFQMGVLKFLSLIVTRRYGRKQTNLKLFADRRPNDLGSHNCHAPVFSRYSVGSSNQTNKRHTLAPICSDPGK